MKNKFIFFIFYFSFALISNAQINQSGGGEVSIQDVKCLTFDKHESLTQNIYKKIREVAAEGLLLRKNKSQNQKFIWPVKPNENSKDPNIQGVSFYVDHDKNFLKQGNLTTLDYNCLGKTYDIENYNHTGTDIFLYPFKWKLMEDEVADVVAAKDGIILSKFDQNFDKNCSFCTNCDWNSIVILHDDNTVSIYGHLKSGSLTNLNELDDVKQGEYLGKVGSSGSSTGPHLHFEVQDFDGNVIDPFSGNCNMITSESLWETQRPYNLPMINALKTSSSIPQFGDCPDDFENSFEKKSFLPGENIILTAYLTDQEKGTNLNLKVINPNGNQIANFSRTFTDDFITSYWYWTIKLSQNAIFGEYILRGSYLNQIVDYKFLVDNSTSISDNQNSNDWIIYNNSEIKLNLKNNEHVKLIDLTGRILFFTDNRNLIENWSFFSPGYYIVSLYKNGYFVESKKLIKI